MPKHVASLWYKIIHIYVIVAATEKFKGKLVNGLDAIERGMVEAITELKRLCIWYLSMERQLTYKGNVNQFRYRYVGMSRTTIPIKRYIEPSMQNC
jgi:hypothetical protein